ncbi:MAG TPA: hypothetical protein VHF58_11155 [Solirubrobacterales bacterium]|nr:hypothetical protein [Solirubrobacterales bacterium]
MATVETTTPAPQTYGATDTAARPERASDNPWARVWGDITSERGARVPYPPGATDFDFGRTRRFAHDPLSILLPLYEEFGPVFSVRLLHARVVFMLGPEANQFVTVTHPHNFHWRE